MPSVLLPRATARRMKKSFGALTAAEAAARATNGAAAAAVASIGSSGLEVAPAVTGPIGAAPVVAGTLPAVPPPPPPQPHNAANKAMRTTFPRIAHLRDLPNEPCRAETMP